MKRKSKLSQWRKFAKDCAVTVARPITSGYRGTIDAVCERALRRKEKTIMSADPRQVQSVAMTLEATLAMSESLPPGEILALTFTHEELNSFVSYMRQLDSEYRELLKIVSKQPAKNAQMAQENPF